MKQLLLCVAAIALGQSVALAVVWNTGATRYNWLLDQRVNSSTNGGSGYGSVGTPKASLSNAQRVWIPSSAVTVTDSRTNAYYGQVDLAEVRAIDYLRVATYQEANVSFTKLIAEFSQDGIDWTQQQVIYDNPGTPITANWLYNQALGQTYNARYVRLEFPAGRYSTDGHAGYGGPGLYGIEPFSPTSTNVEVDGNFDLALTAYSGHNEVGTNFGWGNGSELGNGIMENGSGRAGAANPWGTSTYLTVQLNQIWPVNAVRINWNDGEWYSTGLTLKFSMDGIDYDSIPSVILLPGDPMLGSGTEAARITFDPRAAQYVRWYNTRPNSLTISQEFIVYALPEPTTLSLLALGGLAALRRRSRRA